LQLRFEHQAKPVALAAGSSYHLLSQHLLRSRDGTEALQLRLRAREFPITIELDWRLRPGFSPVETRYTLTNGSRESLIVSRLDTFYHDLARPNGLSLEYVHKGTAFPGTLKVNEDSLGEGETRVLHTSPSETGDMVDSVPWFLLDRGQGRGGLMYAWAFSDTGQFEVAPGADRLQVTGGLAADHFEEVLLSGRTLRSPKGYFGPYAGTPDDAANEWHRFLGQHASLAASDKHSPAVDYNTWYSLGLAVDEVSCMRQLRAAADMGADVFHLDAGWYRAPGDWHPDPKRFPHGLRPLVEEAHRRGMKFGLWVAFTQISETLLKKHPDWVTTPGARIDPHRPFSFRTLTICLGNPAARAWIRHELDRIVTDYGIDLLEYDQPMIEECHVPTHGHQANDGTFAATLGFYELYDGLHRRFPRLMLENCMDGGHIMDFGVLKRTSFTSITDMTDPLHNRIAVYGATYPWPAAACETYMKDTRDVPPEYLFRSFMMGRWTLSADVAGWDAQTREIARRHIALYKQLCPLIRDGDVYHILPQATGREWDGLEYFDRRHGEGVVFVFRPRSPVALQRIHLAGLGTGNYEVRFEGGQGSTLLSASALQSEGLEVALPSPYSAAIVHLRRVSPAMPVLARRLTPAFGHPSPR
jgi:hypothetical protein